CKTMALASRPSRSRSRLRIRQSRWAGRRASCFDAGAQLRHKRLARWRRAIPANLLDKLVDFLIEKVDLARQLGYVSDVANGALFEKRHSRVEDDQVDPFEIADEQAALRLRLVDARKHVLFDRLD